VDREKGFSFATGFVDNWEFWLGVIDIRRCESIAGPLETIFWSRITVAEVDAAPVDVEKVFFTLDRIEVKVYDVCSSSSSPAKGLNEVKLVTSSNLLLLREVDWPLYEPNKGDTDSIGRLMEVAKSFHRIVIIAQENLFGDMSSHVCHSKIVQMCYIVRGHIRQCPPSSSNIVLI